MTRWLFADSRIIEITPQEISDFFLDLGIWNFHGKLECFSRVIAGFTDNKRR